MNQFGRIDLKSAVEWVEANPDKETEGVGRLYGMSANIPVKGVADTFLKRIKYFTGNDLAKAKWICQGVRSKSIDSKLLLVD